MLKSLATEAVFYEMQFNETNATCAECRAEKRASIGSCTVVFGGIWVKALRNCNTRCRYKLDYGALLECLNLERKIETL